ncbi:MAG: hypothetical protein ABI763_17375, partial [Bacteroidota bacterium]
MKRITNLLFLISFFASAQDMKLVGDDSSSEIFNVVYQNPYFNFEKAESSGEFKILNSSGEPIISAIHYYALLIQVRDQKRDTIKVNKFLENNYSENLLPGRKRFTWKGQSIFSDVNIQFNFSENSDEIKIDCETTYNDNIEVIREAFIIGSAQAVTEVYKRNSTIESEDLQNEYWLDKEGVKFGSQKNTLLVYHVPGISSLQLNTSNDELIVNLDFNKDHPFQYFPLRDSMMNEKVDLSCSIFKPGDVRKNSFSIHVGKPVDFVPRLMLNPNGFLAAHVFTEHADWTDLPTHRAVYFGSEEITDAKKATGGFVKNKIPVTKSVFYSNPDHVLNNESRHKSIYTTPIASIQGTTGYLEFLQQLQQAGNEICLHTPDQFTSKSSLVEEACAFMKKNFNSVTWIDHGYNNGPKNNREAFVCDGLNPNSPSYSKDIWEKYGLKYFWNSYYEDFVTDDSAFFDFNGSQMHPYPGFGDAGPSPLYWRNPTRTGSFYSWMTRDLLEMPNPDSWMYHFSTERLNDFVTQRAVKFEH